MQIETEEMVGSNELPRKQAKTCEELLADFHQDPEKEPIENKVMIFHGVNAGEVTRVTDLIDDEADIQQNAGEIVRYNIGKSLDDRGRMRIPVRSEPVWSEHSCVTFFDFDGQATCEAIKDSPVLENNQDPWCSQVQGKNILVTVIPEFISPTESDYHSAVHVFQEDFTEIKEPFAMTDNKVKGVRMIEHPLGVVLFTRPQGEEFGAGQVCFQILPTLDQLPAALVDKRSGKVIDNLFAPSEWGGVNDLCLLADNRIGILGHKARFNSERKKDYFACIWIFNPETGQIDSEEMISTADDATDEEGKPIQPKKDDLASCEYPCWFRRNEDKTMDVYSSIGDRRVRVKKMKDPFLKYEKTLSAV